jgi:hypothetical protein
VATGVKCKLDTLAAMRVFLPCAQSGASVTIHVLPSCGDHTADFRGGKFGSGHITNYAQNENGDVWSLQQLARHIGASAWKVRTAALLLRLRTLHSKVAACALHHMTACNSGYSARTHAGVLTLYRTLWRLNAGTLDTRC